MQIRPYAQNQIDEIGQQALVLKLLSRVHECTTSRPPLQKTTDEFEDGITKYLRDFIPLLVPDETSCPKDAVCVACLQVTKKNVSDSTW